MKAVITVENMRQSDAHTIAHYVPSKTLMYRAAMGVFRAVDWTGGRIGILTGAGNNGGDGYALACILADRGIPCTVLLVSDKFSADGRHYYDLARSKGVTVQTFRPEADLRGYGILVDCMLGTGFSGAVRGLYRWAIRAVNEAGAYVVSVDINSGLNGDTGAGELAVRSDLTVTIGFLKVGFFLGQAPDRIGGLTVADIGIRQLREEYHLAPAEEIIFPNTGWDLYGDEVLLLTPGELEARRGEGQSLPAAAEALARQEGKLVRVLGRYPLVTDGCRTYFLAEGDLPRELDCTGDL